MTDRRIPRFQGPHASYLDRLLCSSKSETIGIDNLVSPTTTKPWSHKGAWPRIIQSELRRLGFNAKILTKEDRWEDYSVIVLDHGMEYNGTFNLYGGANDELASRLDQFLSYTGKIISYEVPMPDVGKFVIDRSKSCTDRFRSLVEKAGELTEKSKAALFADAVTFTGKLVIGDSHSLSVWRQGSEIRRYDGRTLHGAIKRGFESMIYGADQWDSLVLYFGNIDVRHHLCRQPNPKEAARDLLHAYVREIDKISHRVKSLDVIQVAELLPPEDESRRIPKTGYYNGQPFHGDRALRAELVQIFNQELAEIFQDTGTIHWGHLPRNPDGSLSFDAMERPQSVHVSPEFYQFNIETGERWSGSAKEVAISETSTKPPEVADQPKETSAPSPSSQEADSPAIEKKPKPLTIVKLPSIEKNEVYFDLLEYHSKAHLLERRARQEVDVPLPDDPLMCNVHIYDSVHRYCAGFSNLLEDFHYPNRVGKLRNNRVDLKPLRETLYIYLVHRVTGSGASFLPRPPSAVTTEEKMAAKAHGYCNTIIPKLVVLDTVEDMVATALLYDRPYITSRGNIPPQFKAVVGGYDKPSREYICLHAPNLVDGVIEFTSERKRGIREVVDFMNAWNKQRGMAAFNFCYTAFANDMAEYWPQLVDPFSHTYYGPNCERTLSLAFNGTARPRAAAHDQVIEWLVEDTGFMPFDLEDSPACDIQRYWSEEVPEGYGHLHRDQTRNNSLLKREYGETAYYEWVAKNVHKRRSGISSDVLTSELSPSTELNQLVQQS